MAKLPRVKELSEEYASVLEKKKRLYAEYRRARDKMRKYQKALHNTEVFFNMDNTPQSQDAPEHSTSFDRGQK